MKLAKTIPLLLILISVYVIFFVLTDIERTFRAIGSINKFYLLISVSLLLADMSLRVIRWHFFLRPFTNAIPFKQSALYFLSGYAFILSPARAGEIIRSPFLKRDYGISISKTASMVLVERFYDLLAVLAIIEIGLAFSSLEKTIIVIPMGLVLAMLFIITNKKMLKKVLSRLSKMKFVNKIVPDVEDSFEIIHTLIKPKFFLVGTLTSVVASMLEVICVYFLILGLNSEINFYDLIVIFQTSNFVAAASMIPGGIGILEGGLVGLLVLYKIKYEIAVSVALLVRLFSSGMWSAIGLICLRIISKTKR